MLAEPTCRAPEATSPVLPILTALLWSPPAVVRALGIVVAVMGFALALWSLTALGGGPFRGRPAAPARLIFRGPYKRLRHPFYCGLLTFVVGLFAAIPSVAVGAAAVLTIAAVAVAIPLEERRLAERFGEAYRRYRAAVPCLLPVGWHRGRPRR